MSAPGATDTPLATHSYFRSPIKRLRVGTPIQESWDRELRVLLVEDSRPDAELTMRRLKAAGFRCTYQCVVTAAEMRSALRAGLPDLILSDFSMPGFDGMSALAI